MFQFLPRNVVFYDGPSRLTGDRILGIATAKNGNRKIGAMLQLWIVPAQSPIQAVKTGADAAVCGDCKLRGDGAGNGRICYVEYFRAVENIWQSAQKPHRTDLMSVEAFAARVDGLQLRVGAYGDPVAIPMSTWAPLLEVAEGWTAYTHQWGKVALAGDYKPWCMASVDSDEEQRAAAVQGWRTFRVRPAGGALLTGEIVCPHEQNEAIKCASCSLCRGGGRAAKHIAVTVHGVAGRKYFPLMMARA